MVKTEDQEAKSSLFQSLDLRSSALASAGSVLGPEIPALQIRVSMWSSVWEIWVTSCERDSLSVTSLTMLMEGLVLVGIEAGGRTG